MASSMNGLSVEDSVTDNSIGSPVRLENVPCLRDETIMQYSPMSEESGNYLSYDTQGNTSRNQTNMSSPSASPVSSVNKFQKSNTCSSSGNPYPLPSCSLAAMVSSNVRRGTKHEGHIPSSPNDMCHGGDLRRTALLRSLQLRVQGPHLRDFLFGAEHDPEQEHAHVCADKIEHKHENLAGEELERRSCPKSIQDAGLGQHAERDADFVKRIPLRL